MASPAHPLSQLSSSDFTKAKEIIIKQHEPEANLLFRSVFLNEPKKADLISFLEAEHAGTLTSSTPRQPRQASVEYDVVTSAKHEYIRAVVNLDTSDVVSRVPVQAPSWPYFTVQEFAAFYDICVASKLFRDAMSKFTLPEGFVITIDPWPYGGPDVGEEAPRFMQGLVFARDNKHNSKDANHYAYPIPIIPIMDWVTKEVVRIDRLATGGREDGLGPQAEQDTPKELFEKHRAAEYVPELLDQPLRTDLKPLNVVQPEGASFKVYPDGLVEWQKWRFRIGFTPREGAVLHDVCYEHRPVVYRLSYSELTVPYGDPRPPFHRKQAFDFGDGGCGRAANNLELGCDCLGAIHYLDSYLVAPDGSPTLAKSVVCLHEQDNGILWKHTNFRTNRAVVTRNRELVIQFIVTLANYEYIFAYKLDLAAGITLETRATGIMSVVIIDNGKTSDYGNVVGSGILAQNHQHIFAVRIDPAIDGYGIADTKIVVEESHGHKADNKTNPYGNFYSVQRRTVTQAQHIDAAPHLNRTIKLESTSKVNSVSGKSTGYKLISPVTQLLLADENSTVAKRARFAKHHFWVTGYRDQELWAAGEFTNQSTEEEGGVADMVHRGDWFSDDAAASESGKRSSPVLWSVFGLTHNPRVEDWPVMPVEIHQMHLRPADFFTSNPALDVPSKPNEASVLVPCCGTSTGARNTAEKVTSTHDDLTMAHLQGVKDTAPKDLGTAA